MKVKLEIELEEAVVLAGCIKMVAEKSPLGLLSRPLFDMVNYAIERAKGEEDGSQTTKSE